MVHNQLQETLHQLRGFFLNDIIYIYIRISVSIIPGSLHTVLPKRNDFSFRSKIKANRVGEDYV